MDNNTKTGIEKRFSKAMVTGGAGFIGSHIIEELLTTNIDVICIDDLSAGKKENITAFESNPRFQFVKCDISNYEEIKKYFSGVDLVFHQAASKKNICLKDPRRDLWVNGQGTFNLLELARDNGVKKFVHASTGSVYGEAKILPQTEEHPLCPVSYYGVSKLAGERYVKTFEQLYGLDATILRYFHVYGTKQESNDYGGVIAIFARQLLNEKRPTIFGDGTQERSFTYVEDVVEANLFVATREGTKGEVFNCASGVNVTIREMCDMMRELLNKTHLEPEYYEWTIGDIKKFNVSNRKLCNLGFKFNTNFYDGLKITIKDYKKMHNNGQI